MNLLSSLILGAGLLGLTTSAMPVAPPPVPVHFQAHAIHGGDKVELTWTSNASQVRVFVQRKLVQPGGNVEWHTQTGDASQGELAYPRNMQNTGSHVVNTHGTTLGVYRFFIRAKQGSAYSAETHKIVLGGLHD
jgi:hypothetical protein